MKKIAVNTCLNYQRDRKKHQALSLNVEMGDDDFSFLDTILSNENVEETVIYHHNNQLLSKCISQLPEGYRTLLSLRFLADMSYEEIAATTQQPMGTVKNGIYRARGLLKKSMEKYGMLEV